MSTSVNAAPNASSPPASQMTPSCAATAISSRANGASARGSHAAVGAPAADGVGGPLPDAADGAAPVCAGDSAAGEADAGWQAARAIARSRSVARIIDDYHSARVSVSVSVGPAIRYLALRFAVPFL